MINNGDERKTTAHTMSYTIENNIQNFHRAEEMLGKTTDEKMKRQIIEKNARRAETLNTMRIKHK